MLALAGKAEPLIEIHNDKYLSHTCILNIVESTDISTLMIDYCRTGNFFVGKYGK